LRIHLNRQAASPNIDPVGIKRFAKAVLRGEGRTEGALTLVITDDASIRELNARFREKDRATDVLAFPLHEEDDGGLYLGDVIISAERARAQAPRFGNDEESELARLVAHGILHILGYDHHRPADGRRMKAAERKALEAFVPGTLLRTVEGGRA
jgi:probable rRNA maturation factor